MESLTTVQQSHSDKDKNMNIKKDAHTVAAIVARFQVHELSEAHKELIQTVIKEHPKVLIFLGLSPVKGTTTNPLDFQPRKQMILEAFPPKDYPNITIGYIKDQHDDNVWSNNLDRLIGDLLSPNDSVVLYGGRDSFLQHYKGNYPIRELVSNRYISGTEIRRGISEAPLSEKSFRAGAIWSAFQRFPTVYSTVDIAVVDRKNNRILLARKSEEKLFRFIGGFADPNKDDSFEAAASRELYEESTLGSGPLTYVGSFKIDDWRYRNEVDKIFTHLYISWYVMGAAKAADDIAEVQWFNLDKPDTIIKLEDNIVPQHRVLYKAVIEKLKETKL